MHSKDKLRWFKRYLSRTVERKKTGETNLAVWVIYIYLHICILLESAIRERLFNDTDLFSFEWWCLRMCTQRKSGSSRNALLDRPLPVTSCCPFFTWVMLFYLSTLNSSVMPVWCCSCFHGVLTAAYPLTPALLDANAEWSRVTLKRPKARRSCLCWPWSEFPGWAFTKLSLNLPDMCNCDLYQVLLSYNVHVCFCDKNTKHFLRFLHPVRVHVETRVASLCKTVKVLLCFQNILVTFRAATQCHLDQWFSADPVRTDLWPVLGSWSTSWESII